jgi:hypothetical protein
MERNCGFSYIDDVVDVSVAGTNPAVIGDYFNLEDSARHAHSPCSTAD